MATKVLSVSSTGRIRKTTAKVQPSQYSRLQSALQELGIPYGEWVADIRWKALQRQASLLQAS